jgi:glycosyltransferase involved in cell wall biosynthesis
MRIVQLVTQLEAGGAQHVALLLSDELERRGHAVQTWFLYMKRPGPGGHAAIRVMWPARPRVRDVPRLLLCLARAIRQHAPDVLITHTHYANVLGQMVGHACGVQRRIAVQQNPADSYPQVVRWADRIAGSLGLYSANVAVSRAVADSAARYPRTYRRALHTIHNGVSVTGAEGSPDAIRRRFGVPVAAPLLVNLGRLARQKNQALLLDMLELLPAAHLVIVGEGELRVELQRLADRPALRARVHFAGELDRDDGLGIVAAADVFVFPSLFEGLPLALAEAMSLGVPIAASDVPANRELLGDTGILVPAGDAATMAAAVQSILSDASLRERLSTTERRRAESFSVAAMADSYERLLA